MIKIPIRVDRDNGALRGVPCFGISTNDIIEVHLQTEFSGQIIKWLFELIYIMYFPVNLNNDRTLLDDESRGPKLLLKKT